MAYGGAGPVHAASYGAEVGVSRNHRAVPRDGALGVRRARCRTCASACALAIRCRCRSRRRALESIYATMEARRRRSGSTTPMCRRRDRRFERWVEARYRRQVHTVRVPVPATHRRQRGQARSLARLRAGIRAAVRAQARRSKDAGIELVNYGVDAIGVVAQPPAADAPAAAARQRRIGAWPLVPASPRHGRHADLRRPVAAGQAQHRGPGGHRASRHDDRRARPGRRRASTNSATPASRHGH